MILIIIFLSLFSYFFIKNQGKIKVTGDIDSYIIGNVGVDGKVNIDGEVDIYLTVRVWE